MFIGRGDNFSSFYKIFKKIVYICDIICYNIHADKNNISLQTTICVLSSAG